MLLYKNFRDSCCSYPIDVTAPSFTRCPSAISVTTASTEGMTVTWQPPTATDNSAQVTVTSMFDSGDFFDLGVTTVTYRAIDSSGNAATCEFTVTVSKCVKSFRYIK